jgi:hypothetical protein
MENIERGKTVLAILSKFLLYIVAVAMIFAFISSWSITATRITSLVAIRPAEEVHTYYVPLIEKHIFQYY